MAEHNFATSGPKAYYNAKGQYQWCHSKDDVVCAKEAGFTNANYVRSNWPKTAFNKKTGDSKPVGKLEDTDEKNQAAVTALGPDWTLEHVAVPEPVVAKEAAAGAPMDIGVLMAMSAELSRQQKRIDELEEAAIEKDAELTGVRTAFESRLAEIEAVLADLTAPTTPPPHVSQETVTVDQSPAKKAK